MEIEPNPPVHDFKGLNFMGPEFGLQVVLLGLVVIGRTWVIGRRGIRKVFPESGEGFQDPSSSMGLRVSLFVFNVVTLFLVVFLLWLGMLIASLRS